MPVKLRLQRHGRKKRPFYHIVAADSRAARDGRYIERVGWYNPVQNPAVVEIDRERALYWLRNGAQPTNTVRSILSHSGVMYKKHLQRGVDKGALNQEQADDMLAKWLEKKSGEKNTKMVMKEWRIATEASRKESLLKTSSLTGAIADTAEAASETATEVATDVADAAEAVVEKAEEVVDAATENDQTDA